MNNLIQQPADYVNRQTTEPSYDQYCNQTPVPVAVDANWTLTNWTIATTYLTAVAVAQNSTAIVPIPGMLEGHQCKVTIVTAATDQDIEVYIGGTLIGTITEAGTSVFYGKPALGNSLMFKNPGAAACTASITSVVVAGRDPWNENLLPAA